MTPQRYLRAGAPSTIEVKTLTPSFSPSDLTYSTASFPSLLQERVTLTSSQVHREINKRGLVYHI